MAGEMWDNLSRETDRVDGPELRRYMRIVVIAGALCMAFLGLSGGTALAELAKSLGAREGFYGWLNAAPYAAMQLPVSWLVERTRRRKWMFIWSVSAHRALFIPLAMMVFQIGIFDTRWALILTYPTFLIPFCTWLLMGYFRSIPFELEECALIDGATRWQILTKIILPLAVPGLISAGIFAFTLSWNEFLYALTFISASENKTVPVGVITELVEGDVYHWGALMAGALVGSLPVAVMYSFFVEYYVAGMTGAVKE